ncbi:prephenate dehydrogenase [Candidatus Micrarchaeota archaeon]|nr:prephenate dehydrogenase [Candidatus Micrarchaeota archaeon]
MKIMILGAGKMGAWLIQMLVDLENEVLIYDTDNDRTRGQLRPGGQNPKVVTNLSKESLTGVELLINAVSLQNTKAAFDTILPILPKECIISDIASVKTDLKEYYAKAGHPFVSTHPMFGPTFANMDALKEQNAVIIKESDPKGAEFFRKFYGNLGLKIFEYTFEEHDKMMAYSLSTPFAASLVFAACVDNTSVPGTTFKRHREIAKGLLSEDDHLISEILFNKYSLSQLEKITARLEYLKHIIKAEDDEEAKKFFDKLRKNVN